MKSTHCCLKPLVPHYKIQKPIDWDRQFGRHASIDVEIGCGIGEVLIRTAREYPERHFVGIEQNWGRIYKALREIAAQQSPKGAAHQYPKGAQIREACNHGNKMQGPVNPLMSHGSGTAVITQSEIKQEVFEEAAETEQSLKNIRILQIDVRVAFERLFLQKSIDTVYCLFPCPWPKKRHIKHRLFSSDFLKLLNSRLKSRGRLKIVTDYCPYGEWILEQATDTGFKVGVKTINPQYDTKYERKWCGQGQEEFIELDMLKEKSVQMPLKEDSVVKSYRLQAFHPERFSAKIKELGPASPMALGGADDEHRSSIIFKDLVFDAAQQKAMIHVVVAEQDLTQHFWIAVIKNQNSWRVCKAEGQNFFPTPGIARALQCVYEAASATSEEN